MFCECWMMFVFVKNELQDTLIADLLQLDMNPMGGAAAAATAAPIAAPGGGERKGIRKGN